MKNWFKYSKIFVKIFLVMLLISLYYPLVSAENNNPRLLKISILNDTHSTVHWDIFYSNESAKYLPVAYQILTGNIGDVEKGLEYLFFQDVIDIKINSLAEEDLLQINFSMRRNSSETFKTGKFVDIYELEEYAPIGIDVLTIVLPENSFLSYASPGPNKLIGNKLVYHDYNWIYPLLINYTDGNLTPILNDEWANEPPIPISVEDLEISPSQQMGILSIPGTQTNTPYGKNGYSKYSIPNYEVYTGSDSVPGTGKTAYQIANDYKPRIFKGNPLVNDPTTDLDSGYYRIIKGYDPYTNFDSYLIQYYFYWTDQDCFQADHTHDYEPIFIWLRNVGDTPYRVAYDRWDWEDLHLHEIHRTDMWSSYSDTDYNLGAGEVRTQHKSYYPNGKLNYLQDGGDDIRLRTLSSSLSGNWDSNHVKLRWANCYNTFDTEGLSGRPEVTYSLYSLNDNQLTTWYRILEDQATRVCSGNSIMPFKHDISDSFYEIFWEDPSFKYFPTISVTMNSASINNGILTIDTSISYDNTNYGCTDGSPSNYDMRGLWPDRFKGYLDSRPITLLSSSEPASGNYDLTFDISGESSGTYPFKLEVYDNLDKWDSETTLVTIEPSDTDPPTQSNWNPTKGATISTTDPAITFNTDETAWCKWSWDDLGYDSMTNSCSEGTTSQTCTVFGLIPPDDWVYISCKDALDNKDTVSTNEDIHYYISLGPVLDVVASAPDSVIVGSDYNVSGNVFNDGDGDAHNVQLTLNLPSGFTLISGENPQNLGTVSSLGGFASANWTVRADTTGPDFQITVDGTCDEGSTDTDDEIVDVNEPPSLLTDLTAPNKVPEGTTFGISGYVENTGGSRATNVQATLNLPSGLELAFPQDNPEIEPSIPPGDQFYPNWYIKGVSGTYTVSMDITSDEGESGYAEISVEVYTASLEGSLIWNFSNENSGFMGVAIGDIDGDGQNDVAAGGRDSKIYAIKSDGSKLWEYPTGGTLWSVDIGDIDGDGQNDVVGGSSTHYVYAINSDGNLIWQVDAGATVYDVAIGDFNGDGISDVAAGTSGSGYVIAINSSGDVLWTFADVDKVKTISVGDIDGDGKDDVAFGEYDGYDAYALRGYDGAILFGPYTVGNRMYGVDIGDLNGDGKGEVVIGSDDDFVYAIHYDGNTYWTWESADSHMRVVRIGDMDGDGDNDVAVGSPASNRDNVVVLYGNNGSEMLRVALGDVFTSLDIGDLDNDGINDVAAGGSYIDNVWALKSDGNLLWNYTTGKIVYHSIAVGDIDGDGQNDVVAGSYDNDVYVLTTRPVDSEGPVTDFTFVSPDPTNINPTVEAIVTDAISNIDTAEYFIDAIGPNGSSFVMNSQDGSFDSKTEIVTGIIDIAGLIDGNHTVYVHGEDSANNWGAIDNYTFTIDTAPPTITFVPPTPANSTILNVNYVYVNITSNEVLSSALLEWNSVNETMQSTSLNWHLNKTGLENGVYNYKVYAKDTANNWDASETRTVKINLTSICLSVCNLNTGINYSTIQTAINALETLDGHTILVSAGTYIENVEVTKSLNLIGAGMEVTIVSAANSGDHVFDVRNIDSVNISELAAKGATDSSAAGIRFYNSDSSIVKNVNVSNNYYGIRLYSSDGNSIIKTVSSNNNGGIKLSESNNNTISDNIANSNTWDGIQIYNSNNSVIVNNTVINNAHSGINVFYSNNNTVTDNTANSNSWEGIYVYSSYNNTIEGNDIESNGWYGIGISSSSDNKIHNNYFKNAYNFYLYNTNNDWNSTREHDTNIVGGPTLGGNFWAKPTGNGFSEICTDADSDGICDSAHTLSSGNIDYLPLTLSVDTTPPTITFVFPTDVQGTIIADRYHTFVNTTLSESGTAWLEWNGTNESMNGGGVNWYLNKTNLPDGSYPYKVFANDTTGNINVSETRVITVDTTPPIIIITHPRNNTNFNIFHKYINVTGFATDNIMVTNMGYGHSGGHDGGGGWGPLTNPGANVSFNYAINLYEGTNIISISAGDIAGNNVSDSIVVTLLPKEVARQINVTPDNIHRIDTKNETDAVLELMTNASVNGTLTLTASTDPAELNATSMVGLSALGKYLAIDVSDNIKGNLSWAILKMYYTQAELDAVGLDSDSITLLWFNDTSSTWVSLIEGLDWVNEIGKEDEDEPFYIWANVSHFSVYGTGGHYKADLIVNSSDIAFSNSNPTEGDAVIITATIYNVNDTDANNFKVELLVDGVSQTKNTISVKNNSANLTKFTWISIKGTHNISLIADSDGSIDELDETNNKATSQITVSAKPSQSSGGGGGGGAPDDFKASIKEVLADETFNLDIDDEDIPYINGISIIAKQDIFFSTFSVKDYNQKPWSSMKDPDSSSYRYFKVTYNKNNDVKSAKFKISVDKSWLKDNDIDPYTVSLYRFVTNDWEELESEILKEDNEKVYLEAETPGFSYFSIGGEKGSGYKSIALVTTPPPTTPAPTTTPPTTLAPITPAPTTPPLTTPAPAPAGLSNAIKIFLAIALIAATGATAYYQLIMKKR